MHMTFFELNLTHYVELIELIFLKYNFYKQL